MEGDALAGGKKNAARQHAWIFFQDESGISEQPPVRRTWAPKGETPVLTHSFNWHKASVSAAIGYRWDGRRSRLISQTIDGSYNAERLVTFLDELKRRMRGQKVILIWDGLPAHRSRQMNDYLRRQRDWLRVERLPGYAPDLNPVEMLWANVKGSELANRCAGHLGEVVEALNRGLDRVLQSCTLPFSFLHHAGLYF